MSEFLAADLECAVDSYWGHLCHPPGVLHIHPHAAHHPHHSLTRPLTYSLVHLLTHSLIARPPARPLTHSPTHPTVGQYVARHVRALYGTSKPVKLPRVEVH